MPTSTRNLYQTDSGNILTDGGWLGFKLGAVGVQAFAGKFDTTPLLPGLCRYRHRRGIALQPTVRRHRS